MNLQTKTKKSLTEVFEAAETPEQAVELISAALAEMSPFKAHPICHIHWVPIEKVEANDYNPNSVAKNEMRLLHVSISHDGYTQPVVTVYDAERDKYVIVDGFHRYTTFLQSPELQATA